MVPTIQIMDDIEFANDLFLNKKFTQAIDEYTKILENDPQNQTALNNIGYALTKLKKFDLALAYYEKSLKIEPEDRIVLVNKISLYRKTGRIESALKICNDILE